MALEGGDPIADVTAALTTILQGITPPASADKQPAVFDSLEGNPSAFPCFLIIPRRSTPTQRGAGGRMFRHNIDVILAFSAGALGYASKAQRAWVPVMFNEIDTQIRLNDTVQSARITEANYDPVEIGDVPHTAITFSIEAHTAEVFVYAP